MTESQSIKFRKIVDLNWDLSQETDFSIKWQMIKDLNGLIKELREDMGSDEYDKFMDNGRKMFATKD